MKNEKIARINVKKKEKLTDYGNFFMCLENCVKVWLQNIKTTCIIEQNRKNTENFKDL